MTTDYRKNCLRFGSAFSYDLGCLVLPGLFQHISQFFNDALKEELDILANVLIHVLAESLMINKSDSGTLNMKLEPRDC